MDFVVAFVFWLLFATLYLGPSIVAVCRHHHYTPQIVAINIFLGWTIVGLFWAFAWALSATRPNGQSPQDESSTDFAERFFQNRNVIRQPDGGAIIYPGLLSDEAYWLSAREFQTYLQLRAASHRGRRGVFNISPVDGPGTRNGAGNSLHHYLHPRRQCLGPCLPPAP